MNNKIENFGICVLNVYCKSTVVGKFIGCGIQTYNNIKFAKKCKKVVDGIGEYFEKSENWFEETSKELNPEDFHDEYTWESLGKDFIDV